PGGTNLKKALDLKGILKDVETVIKNKSGEEMTVLFSATARKREEEDQILFEGNMKDITQRKRMERQLLQTDKLASLGQLSAGVAHEINNPLGLILGYTRLILKGIDTQTELATDLKTIEKHAVNCKRIVEDLLKFSRSTDTSKSASDLNELLNDVISVVESSFRLEDVQIIRNFSNALPLLILDPNKMKQVFMNLIMNARQAIHDNGILTVSTGIVSDPEKVLISFSDNGSGISPDIIHRIFDPFFTTKPTGMGTGLGLSVSYGIIKDHDGDIQVESIKGQGSTFRIYLHLPTHEMKNTG
ncbi:MAG: ATP-binding protein, partial [Thermodesulfobacteriota bacterium]